MKFMKYCLFESILFYSKLNYYQEGSVGLLKKSEKNGLYPGQILKNPYPGFEKLSWIGNPSTQWSWVIIRTKKKFQRFGLLAKLLWCMRIIFLQKSKFFCESFSRFVVFRFSGDVFCNFETLTKLYNNICWIKVVWNFLLMNLGF